MRIGRSSVHEEPGVKSGMFIAPNEHAGYVFDRFLKGKAKSGALLSIGTFRTVQNSARMHSAGVKSKFKSYMLDYDETTTAFNGRLVELLKTASNRHEFIARLMGEEVAQVGLPSLEGTSSAEHLARDRRLIGTLEKRLEPHAFVTSLPEQLLREMKTMLSHVSGVPWQSSIFGSDALFAIAQRQAKKGVFVPLNGSIAGDKLLPELGLALKKTGQKVSVVDLSNTLEFGTAPLDLVTKNLGKLPLSDDAVVLFTARRLDNVLGYHPPHGRLDWYYLAVPARALLLAQDKGILGTGGYGYGAFMQLLIRHSPPQAEVVTPGPSLIEALEALPSKPAH